MAFNIAGSLPMSDQTLRCFQWRTKYSLLLKTRLISLNLACHAIPLFPEFRAPESDPLKQPLCSHQTVRKPSNPQLSVCCFFFHNLSLLSCSQSTTVKSVSVSTNQLKPSKYSLVVQPMTFSVNFPTVCSLPQTHEHPGCASLFPLSKTFCFLAVKQEAMHWSQSISKQRRNK